MPAEDGNSARERREARERAAKLKGAPRVKDCGLGAEDTWGLEKRGAPMLSMGGAVNLCNARYLVPRAERESARAPNASPEQPYRFAACPAFAALPRVGASSICSPTQNAPGAPQSGGTRAPHMGQCQDVVLSNSRSS